MFRVPLELQSKLSLMVRLHQILLVFIVGCSLLRPAFAEDQQHGATNGAVGVDAIGATAPGIVPGTPANGIEPATAGPSLAQNEEKPKQGIRWGGVLLQTGLLFGMSQGFRLAAQAETRQALQGPYWKDYVTSLKGLGGWGDDDPPLTNYVAHPMMGSTATWILVNNDPKGAPEVFGFRNKRYWISRLKGLGYSAAYSTFYELSPVGDAAVGNLGTNPEFKGAVDLVITPTVGMGWHLTEDMLDKYVVRWVERKTGNAWVNLLVRSWLNPTRSLSNIFRFKTPWKRDSRENLTQVRAWHRMRKSVD